MTLDIMGNAQKNSAQKQAEAKRNAALQAKRAEHQMKNGAVPGEKHFNYGESGKNVRPNAENADAGMAKDNSANSATTTASSHNNVNNTSASVSGSTKPNNSRGRRIMPLAADGYVGGAEKKMVVNVVEGIQVRIDGYLIFM
jgi:hypothetical protein